MGAGLLIRSFLHSVQSLIEFDKTTGIELLYEYSDAIYPVDYFNYLYLQLGDSAERVFHNSIRSEKKDLKRR